MDFTNAFWSPFKELLTTIQYTIYHKRNDLIREYQDLLKQHTNNFTSLLVFPKPNAKHRAELNKGPNEGTMLSSTSPPKKLPARLVQEVLLLSDVLDLNEFSSLELLLVGEDQASRYPSWTRGLVATVLYHDGRRSLLTALKTILQAKQGQSWSISLPEEVDRFTQHYISILLDGELVKQIFDQLRRIDVQNELSRLEKGGGVGDQKHRSLLSCLISDQRQILSDCLFTLSCQEPLSKKNCLELISFLRDSTQTRGDGILDGVTLSVLFSFITSIDVGHLFENESGDELTLNDTYPILSDPTFIPDVTEELMKDKEWKCKELKGCILFAWGQLLRICATASPFSDLQEVESDEALTDAAISLGVFRFLTDSVIASDSFHTEEIYVRKLHQLVTSYIVNMQIKDEQNFMLLISSLYGIDPLSIELSRDFWQISTPSHHLNIPLADSITLAKRRPSAKQTALFNFVRSNGEHLQPDMFTVYLTMLNGLSCGPASAQHCFALLRAFSSYTGSYVSLDHLFNSMKQYANSFSTHGTVGQAHMTSNELEAMNAVLKLLASLAKWDQTVRISLIEHPTWQPLQTLPSLVACPIPCTLKAEIFNLLANLNISPEVGIITWQALEGINIIAKPEKQPTKYTQGIILELQKVESRNETYPETRGFLHLLDQLTDHPIPEKLNFTNYLNFLIDEVYLNIDKRTYHNPEEKWEMLGDVLQIILKLARAYSPETMPTRMSDEVNMSDSPGSVVLMNLLHDSPFLHQLLATLHSGFKILKEEDDVRVAKSHHVDRACLLSLQLLEEGLEKGEVFRKLNSSVGSHALLSSLDALLLGLNPTTNRADHLLVVTMFVSLQLFSPELALSAVNILCSVSNNPSVAKQLCSILTHDPLLSTDILAGFIQRIEVEDWETYEESDILSKEDRNVTSSITSSHIRIRIIQLILININTPSPNLAHFLLGFETRAPVRHTVLQDPGIAGNQRTCLHAILYLISPPPTASNHFTCHSYAPIFSQLAYQMLYTLCSHVDLSAATLRYLRSSKDFFYLQLNSVPFFQLSHTGASSSAAESHLELSLQHQQSWLLRMVALELHITTKKQQRSHTQKLINLLLSDEKEIPVQIPARTDVKSFRAVEEEVILLPSAPGKTVKKLSAILRQMDISDVVPPPLELNYFNQEQILTLIQQHQAKSDLMEMRVIDIKSLHKFINKEMVMANIGLSQKQNVIDEMRLILSFALEQNQAREQTEVKKSLFESWHQMTDTILLSCQEELLPREIKFPLLLELANIILEKALSRNIIIEVIPTLSGSLLTIFSHLAYLHRQNDNDPSKPVHLDTSLMKPLLTSILDLLSCIDKSVQSTRINLYGVLLYYFQMCRRQVDEGESQDIYMRESRITLESMTMSLFNSYGDSLIEIVCRDAFDSTNIIQNLSFSLLEQIILFDEDVHWLKTINILGYLRYIVDSIGKQDSQLVTCVTQGRTTLELFFYEAKISFLTRVAMCIKGPELLSQANLFYTISNMSFIDLRPEVGVLQPVSHAVNSKSVQTYSQLLLPLLRLLLTVLSTAAKRHYDIIFQVTKLVNSHSEIIFSILGSHSNISTLESLQEMSLVSSLLSLSCAHYMQQSSVTNPEIETTSEPLKFLCLRVQRLMLNMLPNYCFKYNTSNLLNQLTTPEGRDADSVRREATLYTLQIANSILRYAAVTMNRDGLDMDITTPKILFNIDITSPMGSSVHGKSQIIPTSALSIGALLQIINDYTTTIIQESDKLSKLELSLITRIIESSLYLLWRHLEFYLVYAIDKSVTTTTGGQARYPGDQSKKYPTSTVVHQTKLNKFKQDIQNHLTDDFFTQLQQVEDKISDPSAPPQARFIDTTVQNIKKLVLQKT